MNKSQSDLDGVEAITKELKGMIEAFRGHPLGLGHTMTLLRALQQVKAPGYRPR